MRNTATTHSGAAIPAQPGPEDAPDSAAAQRGNVSVEGGVSSVTASAGSGGDEVILGAGPRLRVGERATVRLRDTDPDEPARYAPVSYTHL